VVNGDKRPHSRRRGGGRRSWLAGVVALVLLSGPVVLVVLWSHHHPAAEVLSTALGIGIALATLWVGWAAYLNSRGSTAETGELSLADVADQLAASVRAQWEAEAKARGLNDPWPLPVRWTTADASLSNAWGVLVRLATSGRGWPPPSRGWAANPEELAGSDRELVHVLARVPTGRLVVLGEPGAGKTMLMVGLVLDLLARRASGGPVPVLVSLPSWNPVHQDMHRWLAAQLAIDHPSLTIAAPPGTAEGTRISALLEAGLLLPILDGLDEIPDVVRGSAITKINDALRAGEKLVVTCRTAQYEAAVRPAAGVGAPLQASAAIELCPLNAEDVRSYFLDTAGPYAEARWRPVLAALGTETPAGQTLTTPLMVALARAIYNPLPGELAGDLRNPAELCDGSALPDQASVERHLFDAFIPAAYRVSVGWPDRRQRVWTAPQAERWLVFIARHLEFTVRSPNFAWWELERAVPRTVITVTAAIAAVLGLGLTMAVTAGTAAGLISGLITAAGAVLFVLIIGHGCGSPPPLTGLGWAFHPARWFRAWRNNRLSLFSRLTVPSFAVVTLLAGLVFGAAVAVGWLVFGLLVLGVYGAYGDLTDVASPEAVLARDRRAVLPIGIMGFVFGTVGGLVLGAAAGRGARLLFGITDAPALGSAAGAAFGFVAVLSFGVLATATPRWDVTCAWLALRRCLPWNLMSFLEDAHERGVLRQNGALYQFRHIELEHQLAARSPGTSVAKDRLRKPDEQAPTKT
jgi:hypothetical protein